MKNDITKVICNPLSEIRIKPVLMKRLGHLTDRELFVMKTTIKLMEWKKWNLKKQANQ